MKAVVRREHDPDDRRLVRVSLAGPAERDATDMLAQWSQNLEATFARFPGIGIGFAVAPVTSAVMATAPPDRVGNASGVLSATRQVGSLMGIAILGAVLQNRITATITAGIQTVQGIPEAAKPKDHRRRRTSPRR